MKISFLIPGLAIAVLLASCGQEPDPRNGSQIPSSQIGVTAQTSFTLADENGDGSVSRDEASKIANLDFATADADRNDRLSAEEYQTAMEKARPRG